MQRACMILKKVKTVQSDLKALVRALSERSQKRFQIVVLGRFLDDFGNKLFVIDNGTGS